MQARQSPRGTGLRRAAGPLAFGVGICVAVGVAASGGAAQAAELAPAGSVGLVILDERPGVSLGGGGRLSVGMLVVTGVLDLSIAGREDARYPYEWDLFSCRDATTNRDVSWSRCPDPEVRAGLVLDAAIVPGVDTGVRPLIGAGYRVGTVDTPFGLVGLTGSFASGHRWYGRFLIAGRRFLQLHFGVSLR